MMANDLEIRGLFNDSDLLNRVTSAVIKSVAALLDGDSTAENRAYADKVLSNPTPEARKLLMVLLASNSLLSVEDIKNVSQSAIESKVDSLVPQFVKALAGV